MPLPAALTSTSVSQAAPFLMADLFSLASILPISDLLAAVRGLSLLDFHGVAVADPDLRGRVGDPELRRVDHVSRFRESPVQVLRRTLPLDDHAVLLSSMLRTGPLRSGP